MPALQTWARTTPPAFLGLQLAGGTLFKLLTLHDLICDHIHSSSEKQAELAFFLGGGRQGGGNIRIGTQCPFGDLHSTVSEQLHTVPILPKKSGKLHNTEFPHRENDFVLGPTNL